MDTYGYGHGWPGLAAGLGVGRILGDALSGTALRRAWGLPTFTQPAAIDRLPAAVMTPIQAAHYLQVTEVDVLQLIDQGELKAKRIGSKLRIAKANIDAWLVE